jgi:2-keto-3-deoxy-L-rhamnonate aldolase RhmA
MEITLRSSNVRAAIKNGTISHNLTLTFPEPTIAEWAGYAGFDGLHLDMEHGVFDWESAEMMCRVADMHGMTCTSAAYCDGIPLWARWRAFVRYVPGS